jgi:prepilin-type N-terminal cleavage/methylation domain-containing protein
MVRRLLDRRSEAGFTLIELLVVVAIIAILSFTVVTNLSSARAKARDARVASDLQAVSKAIDLYVANGEVTGTTQASFTGTQSGAAAMQGAGGVLTTLKASSNKYLPTGLTVVHPLATGTYSYKGTVTGGTVDYFLCGSTETPTAGFYIIENGSGYTSAVTKC